MRAGQPLPQGDAKRAYVRSMFDRIAPRYDLVNHVMTLGLDGPWRRKTLRLLGLAPGSLVVDLACGPGEFLELMISGGYHVLGVDLSAGMLAASKRRGKLLQADAARLPLATGSADGLVSGFALRNFAQLAQVFAEVARVIRPAGRVALLEVDEPGNGLLRTGHRIYFRRVVPLIGGALSDGAAYRYLPRSVAYLPERRELLGMLEAAGFEDVEHHRLSGGITQVVTGTRKAAPR